MAARAKQSIELRFQDCVSGFTECEEERVQDGEADFRGRHTLRLHGSCTYHRRVFHVLRADRLAIHAIAYFFGIGEEGERREMRRVSMLWTVVTRHCSKSPPALESGDPSIRSL